MLSDFDSMCAYLNSVGVEGEIYEYILFYAGGFEAWAQMPLFIWIRTSEGIMFATIRNVGYLRDVNFFESLKLSIMSAPEYISTYSEKDAAANILGVEKSIYGLKIRNTGALFGLRDVFENLGVTVEWDEENNSVILTNETKGVAAILKIGEYIWKSDAYKLDTYYKGVDKDEFEDYGSSMIRMYDDRTIIDSNLLWIMFGWMLEKNYSYSIEVDNQSSIVYIKREYWDDTDNL